MICIKSKGTGICGRASEEVPITKSPAKSPLAKKSATRSPFRGRPKQILRPSNASNCLAELPFHEEIVIPVKPKKITSTVELRNYEIIRRSITFFILLFLRLFELAFKLTLRPLLIVGFTSGKP